MSIANLTSSLDGWDWFEYFTVAVVIIGVAGESVVEFTSWIEPELRRKKFGRDAALLLIVGLALELVALVKVNNISGRIIATLDNDAAQARKEQELLKQTVSWRIIPIDKLKAMALSLRSAEKKGTVRIAYMLYDSEGFWVARQIELAFEVDPTWKMQYRALGYAGRLVTGVHIAGADRQTVDEIRKAFALTGLSFSRDPVPQPSTWIGDPTESLADAEIVVGVKTPPASSEKIGIPLGALLNVTIPKQKLR